MYTSSDTTVQEVLDAIHTEVSTGKILIEPDGEYAMTLSKKYPWSLSRIAFWEIDGSVSLDIDKSRYRESVEAIFDVFVLKAQASENDEIIVFGDGNLDVVLRMPVHILRKFIFNIVEIPQHLYIFPPDGHWCICYAWEDYVSFAFAPENLPDRKTRKPKKRDS